MVVRERSLASFTGQLTEVAILSHHLANPRTGHLNQAIHIFKYLKSRIFLVGQWAPKAI